MTGLVSGGVSADPLDVEALTRVVERPEAGAQVVFVGRVRNHDPGAAGAVVALDYTGHPSASNVLTGIVDRVLAERDPDGDCRVAAAHRIGRLTIGEAAFVVAVSAPHRKLAFTVCEEVVERVKAELPVWKQQFEADGSYRWSGLS